MNRTLEIGQQVINFGHRATVVGFHPITGDPILQGADKTRWIADSGRCEPVKEAYIHKDGLIVLCLSKT